MIITFKKVRVNRKIKQLRGEVAMTVVPEDRIKHTLLYCESKEDDLHKRLSYLLNQLWEVPGVDKNYLSEIEDIYIKKGELYCDIAYREGYRHGEASKSC